MERLELGPNGGILFCMEYIEQNLDQLKKMILENKCYLIFDCPGQVNCDLLLNVDSLYFITKIYKSTG